MNQLEHTSVQKRSQNASGPDTSPPIGYPTRDKAVGDPPAAAEKTNSKGCCEVLYPGLRRMCHVLRVRIFRMMRLKTLPKPEKQHIRNRGFIIVFLCSLTDHTNIRNKAKTINHGSKAVG
ncbi:unnamed protein product [Arabidopsis thaliana]|uniref:Uncharacterized protein n=1 Tax=Arabidopsis thaliana TaxID=3702 RepID=Q9LID8_ARATH|nr:unnamed protein product [Arabidopsis thaliana]